MYRVRVGKNLGAAFVAPAGLETGWYLPEILQTRVRHVAEEPSAPDMSRVLEQVRSGVEQLQALVDEGRTAPMDVVDIPAPVWGAPLVAEEDAAAENSERSL
jgi:hypothetical protein